MTTPTWDLYRSFLAVLRHGSLSAAAREVGATQPTVGRHIDQLEQAFGVSLFTRSPGGLAPTDAARALRPHAEAMESAAAALERAASGAASGDRGTVRIAASTVVGAEVLPPVLRRLRDEHPGLVLELALSNRVEDLLRRDADVAVRMVRPEQSALLARRIGEVRIGLYATADYVRRHGMPRTVEAMAGHTLIGFDRDDLTVRGVDVGGIKVTRELFSLRCDNDLAQLAALRAGVGIAACHAPIARAAGLVPVLHEVIGFPVDVWVVMHEDLKAHRPVRLVYDALAAGLAEYVAAT
ncbi:MAG: LysR family transcriptional regulator [Burkholderiales bacterium]|nr:LysR family transcriptional regulator [Burkholderiales bacterium]